MDYTYRQFERAFKKWRPRPAWPLRVVLPSSLILGVDEQAAKARLADAITAIGNALTSSEQVNPLSVTGRQRSREIAEQTGLQLADVQDVLWMYKYFSRATRENTQTVVRRRPSEWRAAVPIVCLLVGVVVALAILYWMWSA
jgi:hypothetical protein